MGLTWLGQELVLFTLLTAMQTSSTKPTNSLSLDTSCSIKTSCFKQKIVVLTSQTSNPYPESSCFKYRKILMFAFLYNSFSLNSFSFLPLKQLFIPFSKTAFHSFPQNTFLFLPLKQLLLSSCKTVSHFSPKTVPWYSSNGLSPQFHLFGRFILKQLLP